MLNAKLLRQLDGQMGGVIDARRYGRNDKNYVPPDI